MAAPKASRSIGPLAETQYEIDTREVPRFGCFGRPLLKVMVRPSFLPVMAGVRDISTKGMGLACDRLIAPGACLAVLWDYGAPERWRTLRARVSRASAAVRGGWVIGCTFLERLQLCDVDAFMRSMHQPMRGRHA
jgi:hypothetical protein